MKLCFNSQPDLFHLRFQGWGGKLVRDSGALHQVISVNDENLSNSGHSLNVQTTGWAGY